MAGSEVLVEGSSQAKASKRPIQETIIQTHSRPVSGLQTLSTGQAEGTGPREWPQPHVALALHSPPCLLPRRTPLPQAQLVPGFFGVVSDPHVSLGNERRLKSAVG